MSDFGQTNRITAAIAEIWNSVVR